MFSSIVNFARTMWRDRRIFRVELYLALQSVMLGVWLIAPWSAFRSIPRVYDTLGALMPEIGWGVLFLFHGASYMLALDRNSMAWRQRLAIVHVFLWSVVCMAFLTTAPLSTAVPMYLVPVLGGLWAYHAHTLNGEGHPPPYVPAPREDT